MNKNAIFASIKQTTTTVCKVLLIYLAQSPFPVCGSPDCGLLYFNYGFYYKNKWINELHLKGNKLMLYAMIHAYCVRYGEYSKGILYLSKCLGINKSTVIDCLKWLCEKDY